MSAMRILVASACFMSVGICIAQTLLPERKFDRQMRIIFSLLFIAAIASPIMSGRLNFDFSELSDSVTAFADVYDIEEDMRREIGKNIADGLAEELSARGIPAEKICVDVNIEDENCISITNIGFIPLYDKDAEEISATIKFLLGEDIAVAEVKTDEELS